MESEVKILSAESVERLGGRFPRLVKIKTESKEEREESC